MSVKYNTVLINTNDLKIKFNQKAKSCVQIIFEMRILKEYFNFSLLHITAALLGIKNKQKSRSRKVDGTFFI